MEERQPPPPRNPSRTLAKAGVAVLVVIAIAGIVLTTLQRGPPPEGAGLADATQPASAPMTAASAAVLAEEAEAHPNQIVFAPDSAALSTVAAAKLSAIAEKAKNEKQSLSIVGRVEPKPESNEQRMQLARKRTIAVRAFLESNGVPLARIETRIEGLASGLAAAKGTNRIEVNPR